MRLILQILKFVSGALPIRVGTMDDHRGGRFCEVLCKVALSFHTCFRIGPHPKEGCLSGMRSSDLRRIYITYDLELRVRTMQTTGRPNGEMVYIINAE